MKRHSLLIALCSVLLSALAASPARADEPVREAKLDPLAYPPPGAPLKVAATGIAMTAVWYGAALGGSYLYPTARGAEELRLPVVGPWMSVSQTACPETTPKCSQFLLVLGAIGKVLDGLGQAGGLLILTESFFLPTVEAPAPRARKSVSLWSNLGAAPVVTGASGNAVGLTVLGSF